MSDSVGQMANETAPKNVLRLAWIAMLNDLGSEVLIRLIPLYVSGVLGASMTTVGAIEGFAEATATVLKPLFGWLSDRWGKRKVFIFWGYGFSALSRPFMALAGSSFEIAFLRAFDRTGKGVRIAPRDALIADSGKLGQHGRNFGINRALDTLGALIGVGAVGLWIHWRGDWNITAANWRAIVVVCSIPGFLALLFVAFGITEPARGAAAAAPDFRGKLNPTFKKYLIVVALFSFANSSDAFILLRARELGYSLAETLGIVALLNLVSTLTIMPASILSERFGRRTLIALGWVVFAVAYALIGTETAEGSRWAFAAIIGAYGLFYGFTDSVERAWIADLTDSGSRGRAYGFFGLVVGATTLPASLLFGWVWDVWGSEVAFLASSTLALFATALLFALIPQRPPVISPNWPT